MNPVEEGVANFRDFQTDVRKFIIRADTRAEEREELDKHRSRIHYWWLALLSAIIVYCFTALLGWVLSFESRHHVSVSQNPGTTQTDAGRRY